MKPEILNRMKHEWKSSDKMGRFLALQVIVGNTALVVGLANNDSNLALEGMAVGWVAPRTTLEIASRLTKSKLSEDLTHQSSLI